MTTAHIIHRGQQIDQWTPAPIMQVGDTIPDYGFKPSSGPERRFRIMQVHWDYRKDVVAYTVVPT